MSLKDFEFFNKLGEGAFSVVYKVKRKSDNETYALKQVKLGSLSRKEKENALNEIRILASLDHVNIIGFKEAFLDDKLSLLCIVMEFAENGDLYNLISKSKAQRAAIPESEIWSILSQTLQALHCLHSSSILHRDIKSANIFVTSSKVVKLGDLNVSKVMKQGLAYTQTGTPYYASPEVWKDQPYNSASDIWSLGCVIYELAALVPPFNGRDMSALSRSVIRGIYSDPAGVSKDLAKVIRAMLQVNPGLRPSAKDLLETTNFSSRNSNCISMKKNFSLLKTIFFDNKVNALRSRLPKSQYYRQLSVDSFKENLPSIDDSKLVNKSCAREVVESALPAIPMHKALPPKAPRALNVSNNSSNQNNESKAPMVGQKNVAGPVVITHSPLVSPQIKRIGSLIIEQRRYHSPQAPVYERVASLGALEKPSSPMPAWWG